MFYGLSVLGEGEFLKWVFGIISIPMVALSVQRGLGWIMFPEFHPGPQVCLITSFLKKIGV